MSFDPQNVNLDMVDPSEVVCYLTLGSNEYSGNLGSRIVAVFVILVVSSVGTVFPVLATKVRRLKLPLYVYLFARYFGAGVIVATAFIHLLDPAYAEIGPNTCVGMTGNWAVYSWPPAIVVVSVMFIFLLDFCAERLVAKTCGLAHGPVCQRDAGNESPEGAGTGTGSRTCNTADHSHLHSGDQDEIELAGALSSLAPPLQDQKEDVNPTSPADDVPFQYARGKGGRDASSDTLADEKVAAAAQVERDRSFRQQISAFLILEFGIIFHSVIIGLTLGTAGDEFSTLYPVIVIHQTFEGLGIGARLSAIPIPRSWDWLPWFLCAAYGLTTPVAMAIGLGMRYTYNGNSFTANVVSGVLDSISAGVLIYTGLVELLARDFLFNSKRMNDSSGRLAFMIGCTLLGAALMALLGKWA